jgi:hypothetical protein
MRRTAALVVVTLLLFATVAPAARRDVVTPPPATDAAPAAVVAPGPDAATRGRPAGPGGSSEGPEPSFAPEADTLAQGDGPVQQAAAAPEDGASASQRPALIQVLDPAAGATRVAGGSAAAGDGPTHRYSVEVEASLGLDVELVRAIVEGALHDEERSWARTRTLQRVDDPRVARIRVVLASPATVDAICATVGLDTASIYSCWTGRIAALNAWRWEVGATGFPDVATYRTYLINHEFGHALGYGHVSCPGPGSPAPVMMQQSKGLAGCSANGWPYP